MSLLLAGIGAGTSLVGGALNRRNQRKQQDKGIEANVDAADLAYQRQVEMWNKANEYNSPVAQRDRMLEAGFNPNLIAGGASSGNAASSAPQYTPPDQSRKDFDLPLPSVLGLYNQQRVTDAQVNKMDAETKRIDEMTLTEGINRTLKQLNLISADLTNQQKSFIVKHQKDVLDAKMNLQMQQFSNMIKDNELKGLRIGEEKYYKDLRETYGLDKYTSQVGRSVIDSAQIMNRFREYINSMLSQYPNPISR